MSQCVHFLDDYCFINRMSEIDLGYEDCKYRLPTESVYSLKEHLILFFIGTYIYVLFSVLV